MRSVYQHYREKHLHRYLAEHDFATTTVSRSASTTWPGPPSSCAASPASG
jgi:hypothetical protein